MIAKRIDTKAASPRIARLVRYVVAAQGGIDPRSWSRTADYVLNSGTSSRGEKVGGVRVTHCHTDDPAAATALIECTQAANTRSHTDKTYHLVFSAFLRAKNLPLKSSMPSKINYAPPSDTPTISASVPCILTVTICTSMWPSTRFTPRDTRT